MKKSLTLIAGLMFMAVADIIAVENVSFRLKGMHSDLQALVKDEYTDMMYMPHNILEIDAYRLYTNLSNLSTGNEEALDETPVSANEYLIGGVAPFSQLHFGKLGFIYGADSSLTPRTIRKETGASIGETGEYEYLWTSNTSTASYREYGKAEQEILESDISYLLGFQPLDALKFGFLLNFSASEDITTNAYSLKNNQWTLGNSSYSLVTSNVTDSETENYITLGPSAELQVNDQLAVGAMLGIIFGEREYGDSTTRSWYSTPDFGWWWSSYDGGINSTCTYSRVNTSGMTGKPEGTGLGLKLMGKYAASDNLQLRGIFNYQSISLSGNISEPNVLNLINNGSDGSLKTDSTRSGDMVIDRNNMAIGAGFESKMDKDLMLTMGIKYSVEDYETNYSKGGIYRVNNVAQSYLSTIQTTDKQTTTELILPLGIEHKPKKWLTLRMGASHKITTTESEDRTTTTNYSAAAYPVKTVTTVVTTVDPKSSTIVRDTDYSFGAGFQVSDNLQIDLLNFTNLTDMSFWKLSATLKFYGNSEQGAGRKTSMSSGDKSELKKKYWQRAAREYNKANYEKAISYWEKILDIDPNHKLSLQKIEQTQKVMKNF